MDGGLSIENALRIAVEKQKYFYQFADIGRGVANNLGLDDTERDRIFEALAKAIKRWPDY